MKFFPRISPFVLVAVLMSCCKDDSCPGVPADEYVYLTEDEKSKIPYTGTETLRFVSNNLDSIDLEGNGRTSNAACEERPRSVRCGDAGHICYEVNGFTFRNPKYRDSLFFITSTTVNNRRVKFELFSLEFEIYLSAVGRKTSLYNLYESIVLNGTTYNKVSIITGKDINDSLLYNAQEGIIKVSIKGKTWTRY